MNILTNTKSGAAGEQNVIAKLMRFGINISKPCWNDDEVDFEVRYGQGDNSVNIPFQVKSVQINSTRKTIFIQGLKKKYIERNELLCLAIYNPDNDWLWLLVGKLEIIKTYENQQKWNRRHISFAKINPNDDVRIAVPSNGFSLLSEFKIEPSDKEKVVNSINKIAERKRVTIISEEKNESIDLYSDIKIFISNEELLNFHSASTEYIIEGNILNIIAITHKTFIDFIDQTNLERDFIVLFRALFINSIAHRSYENNQPNRIELSKNKIIISNPGGLPKELTLEALMTEHISVTRNPKLTYDLNKLGVMESMGSGILYSMRIMDTLTDWDLEFKVTDNNFITEIKKVTKT